MKLVKKKKKKKQKMGEKKEKKWGYMPKEQIEDSENICCPNIYLVYDEGCNNIQWREYMNLYRCCWKILRDKNKRMELRHSLLLFPGQVIPDCL